jgi:hypothetical protein
MYGSKGCNTSPARRYYRLKFAGSRRRIGRRYNDLEKILAVVAQH